MFAYPCARIHEDSTIEVFYDLVAIWRLFFGSDEHIIQYHCSKAIDDIPFSVFGLNEMVQWQESLSSTLIEIDAVEGILQQ